MPSTISDFGKNVKLMTPLSGFADGINLGAETEYLVHPKNYYSRSVSIDLTGKPATDIIAFTINTEAIYDQNKCGASFNDLRVYDSDLVTELAFYVQAPNTTHTIVFIKFASNISGTRTIYITYGNPSLKNKSSATAVFGSNFGNNLGDSLWFRANEANELANWKQSGQTKVNVWKSHTSAIDVSQSSSARRPDLIQNQLNGQPVLRFDGANHFLTSNTGNFDFPGRMPSIFSDRYTFIIVARASSLQNYQSIIRFQDSGGSFKVYPWWNAGTGQAQSILYNDGGTSGIDTGMVPNQWNVGVCRYLMNTTNGFNTYRNGALVAQRNSANNSTVNNNMLIIGALHSGGTLSEYFNGDLAEVIISDVYLSDTDRAIYERYLNLKYRIYNTSDFPTVSVSSESVIVDDFTFDYEGQANFSSFTSLSKLNDSLTGIATNDSSVNIQRSLSKPLFVGSYLEDWDFQTSGADFDTTQQYSYSESCVTWNIGTTAFTAAIAPVVRFDRGGRGRLNQYNSIDIITALEHTSSSSDFVSFYLYVENAANIDLANSRINILTSPSSGDIFRGNLSSNLSTLRNGINKVIIRKSSFVVIGSPSWSNDNVMLFRFQTTTGTQRVAVSLGCLEADYNADKYRALRPIRLSNHVSSDGGATYYQKILLEGRTSAVQPTKQTLKVEAKDILNTIIDKRLDEFEAWPTAYNYILFASTLLTGGSSNNRKWRYYTEMTQKLLGLVFPKGMLDIDLDMRDPVDTTTLLGTNPDTRLFTLNFLALNGMDKFGDTLERILRACGGAVWYDQQTNKVTARNGYKLTSSRYTNQTPFDLQDKYIYSYQTETGQTFRPENAILLTEYSELLQINQGIYWENNLSITMPPSTITTATFKIPDYWQKRAEKIKLLGNLRLDGYGISNAQGSSTFDQAGVIILETRLIDDEITMRMRNYSGITKYLFIVSFTADYVIYRPNREQRPQTISPYTGKIFDWNVSIVTINDYGVHEYDLPDEYAFFGRNSSGGYATPDLYLGRLFQFGYDRAIIETLECQYLPDLNVGRFVRYRSESGRILQSIVTECQHLSVQGQYRTMLKLRSLH